MLSYFDRRNSVPLLDCQAELKDPICPSVVVRLWDFNPFTLHLNGKERLKLVPIHGSVASQTVSFCCAKTLVLIDCENNPFLKK